MKFLFAILFQGWEQFTDAVIRWINSNLTGVVFLLWGAYAQKKGSFIDKVQNSFINSYSSL